MRLAAQRVSCIQLAIEQAMQQQLFVSTRTHRICSTSAPSICRARESRDITVPTGTPVTSAICLYDNSSSSRSTNVSRNGSGNRRIIARTSSISLWRNTAASGPSWVQSPSSSGLGIHLSNDSPTELSLTRAGNNDSFAPEAAASGLPDNPAARRLDLDQSNEQLRTIASNHDFASPPR